MSNWIDIKERKPDTNGDYLVDTKMWAEITLARYEDGVWFDCNGFEHRQECTWNVIAWQPLPERFKPESHEIR